MNEVLEVFLKHFNNDHNTIWFHGEEKSVVWFRNMLDNYEVLEREAPDAIIIGEQEVLAIEHFEFDCYKTGRRGSQGKRERARITQEEDKLSLSDGDIYYHDTIRGETSYTNYLDSVFRSLRKHYCKIDTYKQNLKSEGVLTPEKDFKMMFLIDDASPMGSSYIDESGKWVPITLAHSKEFLEYLRNFEEVDFILATSFYDNQKYDWFISVADLDEYLLNSENYSDGSFVSLHPHTVYMTRSLYPLEE